MAKISALADYPIAIFGFGLVAWIVHMLSGLAYPFAADAVTYIQQAENFLNRGGFYETPFGLSALNGDLIPSAVFPPGYPILIAAVSVFGVPTHTAAMLVSWFAWGVLPAALLYALGPLTGRGIAVLVAFLTAISPGAIDFGFLAAADLPFLVFIAFSAGLLIRSFERSASPVAIFVSGLLAGCAYSVRNAGLVMFPAVITAFLFALCCGYISVHDTVRKLGVWFLGAALVCVPLVVRNYLVFGKVQSYMGSHQDSDFSFLRSLRTYFWSAILDIAASHSAADIAWNGFLFFVLGLPIVLFVAAGLYRFYRRADAAVRVACVWAGCYILFGSAMVVIGRASFDWVETSLVRHVMQYSWLILALICLALRELLVGQQAWPVTLAGVALVLASTHALYLTQFIHKERVIQNAFIRYADLSDAVRVIPDPRWVTSNQLMIKFSTDQPLIDQVKQLPAAAMLLSNYGKVLSLATGRPVRELPLDDMPTAEFVASITKAGMFVSQKRPYFVALLPTNRVLRTVGINAWQDAIIRSTASSFSVVTREPHLLLLRFEADSA